MKSCAKEAFRLSFQHAEGLEHISQAWQDKMEGGYKFYSRLFHSFSAMPGRPIEQEIHWPFTHC
jgi:hypothetical protein